MIKTASMQCSEAISRVITANIRKRRAGGYQNQATKVELYYAETPTQGNVSGLKRNSCLYT